MLFAVTTGILIMNVFSFFSDLGTASGALPIAEDSCVNVSVDFANKTGRIRSLQGINRGPLGCGWGVADLFDQYRDIGVDYVRIHDFYGPGDVNEIFPDFEADPSIQSSYIFSSTDKALQAIKAIGANIVFRLGYSWGGPNSPPSNFTKWADICRHIIMHYNDGWADGFHFNITYWEVWNEPDMKEFWTGTWSEYIELYTTVALVIKSYNTCLKVGGPTVLFFNIQLIESFLEHCRANEVPLDFVSWHFYPGCINPYALHESAKLVQDLLGRYGFISAESLLTEWNMYGDWPHEEFGNAKGAAWTASILGYMQDTTISVSCRYRGDRGGAVNGDDYGIFYNNSTYKKTGYAFLAFKSLLETPNRLASSGGDALGYVAIAGKSDKDNMMIVMISDFNSTYGGYKIHIKNLPWAGQKLVCERYVLDIDHDLTLVEFQTFDGSSSFFVSKEMASPSVQLIKLYTRFVSCLAQKAIVAMHDSVTVMGSVYPTLENTLVNLTYCKPDKTLLVRSSIVGIDGKYSDVFAPKMTGLWTVEASWAELTSPVTLFTVLEMPDPTFYSQLILIVGIAIAGIVIFAVSYKKRHSHSHVRLEKQKHIRMSV
jgi:hypothetical protein